MKSTALHSRFYLTCSLAIVLVALAARLLPGPRTIDDSYITFRYAKNILAGNGFAYNPGERVLGTTTPLYTILLTGLALPLGGENAPFPQIAMTVNALADGLTCLVLLQLGRRLGSAWAGLGAALAWAVAPFSVTFAIGGLETSVYVLLLTATASAHIHQRRIPAALLGALALLTRPDALILLGPLFLDRVRQGNRGIGEKGKSSPIPLFPYSPILLESITFLLPVLGWVTFATSYFGSPIPHSVTAKSLAYRLPETAALARLLQHYATPFQEHLTFGVPAIAAGLVLYPFLFIIGARRAIHANPRAWPWLAYPWLYFAAFALAHPLIFRWYLTPPLPAYILGILMGLEGVLESVRGIRPNPPVPPSLLGKGGEGKRFDPDPHAVIPDKGREGVLFEPDPPPSLAGKGEQGGLGLMPLLIVLVPLSLSLRGWTAQPDHGLARPAPEMAWYQLELLYRQAAAALAPEMARDPDSKLLAAGDVGVLGFTTGARILDTVGLNSPQALEYYPLDPELYTINYAVSPDLILDLQPDYIVMLEVYVREGLLKEARFWQDYELLRKIPTDIYGSDGMLIFQRHP